MCSLQKYFRKCLLGLLTDLWASKPHHQATVMVVDILSKPCHLPFWLRRLVRLPILRFLFAISYTSGESPDENQKHPGSDLHILFPLLTGANISLPSLASPCKAGGCEDEVGGRVTTWQMRTQNTGWGQEQIKSGISVSPSTLVYLHQLWSLSEGPDGVLSILIKSYLQGCWRKKKMPA